MPSMDNLTVITHVRNHAPGLAKLLPTVRWAHEVIVVDMQSEDASTAVARAAGARVLSTELHPRVDAIRNRFLSEAHTEWVLVLDADEYLAEDASERIRQLLAEHGPGYDAFALPRFNRIGAHIMRGSGWYPDHQVRLFRRDAVRWPDATHQPPTVLTGPQRLRLLAPEDGLHIHHDNYANLRDFMARQLRYALQDTYDPAAFDADHYAAQALEELARRHDPAADGDLSRALALIMAWDKTMRGLIHWDQLPDRPSLEGYCTLPVAVAQTDVQRELLETRAALADRERQLHTMRNSRVQRLCRWWDRVRGRRAAGMG